MKSQRKTEATSWVTTSEDYLIRTARGASLKVAGTSKKPILASDSSVSDNKILGFISASGDSGVVINSITVRRIEE